MNFDVIICFEVHAELDTKTKLFCKCSTNSDAPPNTNVCPVCTGQPGALPVLNRMAVEHCVRAGLSLNCTIANHAGFARKNYFYPDLPKGYQISQFEFPFCTDGFLEIMDDNGKEYKVGIKRVHLEEDAGKLLHASGSLKTSTYSLVDFNRAGVPLIEIVADHTRNPIRSLTEARLYLEKIRQILRYIGVSKCRMEKGELRCDANISLRQKGSKEFGNRVEMKNMASFKLVLEALSYEIKRQSGKLRAGETIIQETRLYDEASKVTVPMRSKENAPDYRYFPEPDLVDIDLDRGYIEKLTNETPELPEQKANRIIKDYGIPAGDAVILTKEKGVSDYFLSCVPICSDTSRASKWIIKELFKLLNASSIPIEKCPVTPERFSMLINLLSNGDITDIIGRTVLEEMFHDETEPLDIIKKKGLEPIENKDELKKTVDTVLLQNRGAVSQIRQGNTKSISYLIGQVMKKTNGRANPKETRDLIDEAIRG